MPDQPVRTVKSNTVVLEKTAIERGLIAAWRFVMASPLGFIVAVAGIGFGIWANNRVDYFFDYSASDDARHMLSVIRVASLGIWAVVVLLGIQMMISARRQERMNARIDDQLRLLTRLELKIGTAGQTRELSKAPSSLWNRVRRGVGF